MDEDVRKDEPTDEPDETEETTDRRDFLKQAGMVGGGALAAIAGLASAADAQYDIRTGPRGRMAPTLENILNIPAREDVASVEEFKSAFDRMQEVGIVEPPPNPWTPSNGPQVAEILADFSDPEAIAAVNIVEMRSRFDDNPDGTTANLTILYTVLAEGMEQIRGSGWDPRALGNGCGDGCGNNCGNACLSPVAAGFICGNGCGNDCAGSEAMGLQCGNGCENMGLEQLTIDRMGHVLGERSFKGLNMKAFAAAMRNANRAFDTDLGGPFQREG
jgi:hypothetical protein